MAYLIKHRLAIYLDSNSRFFYQKPVIKRQINSLNKDLHIPYVYREAPFKDNFEVQLSDLAPLDHDLNIVLLPNRAHVVHIDLQAQHIVLQIGFGKRENGSYYTFIKRIRHYLTGEPLDIGGKALYGYAPPYVKLMDICTFLDVKNIRIFSLLRKAILNLRISVKNRYKALRILNFKKTLFFKYASLKDLQERNHSIKFRGHSYKAFTLLKLRRRDGIMQSM